MLIASCIDGRLRIRDQQLTQKHFAEAVREALSALPGISQVNINEKIGSLLIVYSAAVTNLRGILDAIIEQLGEVEEPLNARSGERASGKQPLGPAGRKSAVNMGMLASLLTSVIGIMLGLKKLHVGAGILFLAFFGIHFFKRRRAVFA